MNLVFLVATAILSTQAADWNYQNFSQWTTIDARCGNPSNQSPRNLTRASSVLSQQCKTLAWSNSYARDFTVKNNGHGITMIPKNLLPSEKTANTFVWEGTTWCLEQFHFHWSQDSHGAEHRLENFDNGLEAHFVHRDCRFDNLTHALTSEKTSVGTINSVAVIGIMYEVSNSGDAILQHLLNDKVVTSQVKNGTGTSEVKALDYTHMLPNIPNRSFFSYQGSLTTPTCDPVLWFVVESQEKVTAAELAILRQVKDKAGAVMTTNQRPVQENGQTLHFYEPCRATSPTTPKPGSGGGSSTTSTTTTTTEPPTTTTKEGSSGSTTSSASPCPKNNNANAADTSTSSGIETGTFVGAVIGCLIGGLILGAILVHVCVMNDAACYGVNRDDEGKAVSPRGFVRQPSTESEAAEIVGQNNDENGEHRQSRVI